VRIRIATLVVAGLLAVLVAGQAHAESVTGRVVRVIDGDTIAVLVSQTNQVMVRLGEIDAPEGKQPFSEKAKVALSSLVFGEVVRVDITGHDRWRRTVGHIYGGETWVNLRMVELGMAWCHVKYVHSQALQDAQERTKAAKVGLWADPEPVPPWEWRRHRREKAE